MADKNCIVFLRGQRSVSFIGDINRSESNAAFKAEFIRCLEQRHLLCFDKPDRIVIGLKFGIVVGH